MSQVTRHRVTVNTDGSGNAKEYTPAVTGRLVNIIYTKPNSDGLATADFDITAENTGLRLWKETGVNASKTVSPTQDLHDQDGDDLVHETVEGNGDLIAAGSIYLANERIEVDIKNGGDDKDGAFDILVVGPTG